MDGRTIYQTYVKQNLRRKKVLDFVKEKNSNYKWSLRTLCRGLNHFGIKFIDYDTDLGIIEHHTSGHHSILSERSTWRFGRSDRQHPVRTIYTKQN